MDERNSMKMEVASIKELVIVGCICLGLVFISLVVGATGPAQYFEYKTYASNCSSASFTPCAGGVVLRHNQTWSYDLPKLTPMNRWWVMNAFPYVSPNDPYYSSGVETAVPIQISLWGKNKVSDAYQVVEKTESRQYQTICFPYQDECFGFSVVDENYLRFPYYRVELSSPNINNGTSWLGDVKFDFWTMNPKFNQEVVIMRGVYAGIALLVTVFWFGFNLQRKFHSWTTEQKFTGAFLFSLFFMLNPFYFAEYTSIGWALPFLNSFLETQFVSLFLIFCLIYLEMLKFRDRDPQNKFQMIAIKVGLVSLHAILSLVLYIWNAVVLEHDAIISQTNGIQVVYYLVSGLYGGIIVWVIVLCITIVPTIQNYPEIRIKFLFLIIPISVIVGSVALGVFTGTYGAYGRGAVSFYYFFTLYSIFVFLLAYGTWPVKAGFNRGGANESSRLFSSENNISISNNNNNNNNSNNDNSRSTNIVIEEDNTLKNPFSNAQYFEEDTDNYKKTDKREEDYQPITSKIKDDEYEDI